MDVLIPRMFSNKLRIQQTGSLEGSQIGLILDACGFESTTRLTLNPIKQGS